jgi:hypothetical protein
MFCDLLKSSTTEQGELNLVSRFYAVPLQSCIYHFSYHTVIFSFFLFFYLGVPFY